MTRLTNRLLNRLPKVLIYGDDGIDQDIVINLSIFYTKMGYQIIVSTELHEADILVLTRVTRPLENLDFIDRYELINYWSYVGEFEDESFIEKSRERLVMISTDVEKLQACELLNPHGLYFNLNNPVYPKFWTSLNLKSEKKYNSVHIGNYKSFLSVEKDCPGFNFLEFCRLHKVSVWGNGWLSSNLPFDLNCGPLKLEEVPRIYRQSEVSFGIMYPDQRGRFVSGRFWLGPINGCLMYTEAILPHQEIPGVYYFDYQKLRFPKELQQSRNLALEARVFWTQSTKSAFEIIKNANLRKRHHNFALLTISSAFGLIRLVKRYWKFYLKLTLVSGLIQQTRVTGSREL